MSHQPGLAHLRPLPNDLYELATLTLPGGQKGTVTIANPDTSAAVTLAHPTADATYTVQVSVNATSGSPAAGSLRPYVTARATTGFTINLEATPGGAATVTVAWWMSP